MCVSTVVHTATKHSSSSSRVAFHTLAYNALMYYESVTVYSDIYARNKWQQQPAHTTVTTFKTTKYRCERNFIFADTHTHIHSHKH